MISRDFPLLPGKQPKYNRSNSCELQLNFGDIIYRLSKNTMHYLDDREALGWSWLPPEDLINRVMKGGTIKFETEILERFTLQIKNIGFLLNRRLIEESKGEEKNHFEFLDAKSDSHLRDAVPAKLGQAPACFIERMQQIVAAALRYEKEGRSNSITFPPHPSYDHMQIAKAPESELDYASKFMKLYWQNKSKGIKLSEPKEELNFKTYNGNMVKIDLKALFREDSTPYHIASHIRFISLNDDMAVADLRSIMPRELAYTYFSDAWKHEAGAKYIRDNFNDIFRQLGIEFEKSSNPLFLIVSKDNLKHLQKMGAELIHLNKDLTLEDKIAVAFGHKPKEVVVKSDSIEATFNDDDSSMGLRDWMRWSEIEQENEWRSLYARGLSYFKIEQKGIGDRLLDSIDNTLSWSLVLKVIQIENAKRAASSSLLHDSVMSIFKSKPPEKKEETHCAMRLC